MSPIIKRAIVSFTLEATVITAKSTRKLPILETMAIDTSVTRLNPNNEAKVDDPIIKKAAPKLAPELIPSTNGPAKGFLNKVCIKSPLKDNPAPTNIAVKALGIL